LRLYTVLKEATHRRRAGLPLVNKRWARVLQGPSHAWRNVSIGYRFDEEEEENYVVFHDFTEEVDKRRGQAIDRPPNAAVVLDWFTSRTG